MVRVTDSLETFDVVERPLDWLAAKHANVSVAYCHAVSVDDGAGVVTCDGAVVLAGAPRITAVVSANPSRALPHRRYPCAVRSGVRVHRGAADACRGAPARAGRAGQIGEGRRCLHCAWMT